LLSVVARDGETDQAIWTGPESAKHAAIVGTTDRDSCVAEVEVKIARETAPWQFGPAAGAATRTRHAELMGPQTPPDRQGRVGWPTKPVRQEPVAVDPMGVEAQLAFWAMLEGHEVAIGVGVAKQRELL